MELEIKCSTIIHFINSLCLSIIVQSLNYKSSNEIIKNYENVQMYIDVDKCGLISIF